MTAPAQTGGQTLTILHIKGTDFDQNFRSLVPDFEKKTGIQTTMDHLPEEQEMPKITTIFGAKSDEYDVFWYRGNLMPNVIDSGAVEPLDDYIAKSKSADAAFAYDDFIPGLVSAFNFKGKQWGLPALGGGNMLFYNKDAFSAASLSQPPRNLDELEQYATKLTRAGQAGFTLRGKREAGTNVFSWIFIWKLQGPKWYDNIRGNWFDPDWQPQLATPEAITATERWAKLLRDSGPKGIASYGYQESLLDFQQGAVAMFMDDVGLVSSIEDSKQSKVVGKTGYAMVEGPGDRYGAVAPWGFIMNAASKKKEAAWEFVKWATGPETQLNMVKNGYGRPSRRSALEGDAMKQRLPPEYVTALARAMAVADPAYKPLIPQQAEINDLASVAISQVLIGQGTAQAAMTDANAKVLAIMKRDGYIKA